MTQQPEELPIVEALRSLSIFGPDQAGAFREHFAPVAEVLGEDIETKLTSHVEAWATSREPGLLVLTGNAGTGKTAAAEAFCRAVAAKLPSPDSLTEVASGAWLVKDFSGLTSADSRAYTLTRCLELAQTAQVLLCANEGVLRASLEDQTHPELAYALEAALSEGASVGRVTVVNVNRQRPTAEPLWSSLLDYLTREDLWEGCDGCPFDMGGCSMRSNAAAMRRPEVRSQIRLLVQLGIGEAVPTMREVLAVLAHALVGSMSCEEAKRNWRGPGLDTSNAGEAYYSRLLGGGLQNEQIERSPLMSGMKKSSLGDVSDLEIDGWLRDTRGAPEVIRALAGDPSLGASAGSQAAGSSKGRLAGSNSPLDRVNTNQGAMTFYALGDMVSTDEDLTRVEDGLDALVAGDATNAPAQQLWRQRVFFEGSQSVGDASGAAMRLLDFRYFPELVDLARRTAEGRDTVMQLATMVRGLNFLVTGFASADEGLVAIPFS